MKKSYTPVIVRMFAEILASKVAFCHSQMERPKKVRSFCQIARKGTKCTKLTVKEICLDCNCGTRKSSLQPFLALSNTEEFQKTI